MKVKLKTCMAGPDGAFLPGDIVEDNGELVKGGYAEPFEESETVHAGNPSEKVEEIHEMPPVMPPKKKR